VSSKDVVSAVREAYGQTLSRGAHGVGHYEDCWKDHYPCLIELLLSEIGELRFHVNGLKTENAAFAEREARSPVETTSTLDAEFFEALDGCNTQEPLQVYDSNSWRRVGLASTYKEIVYPERQRTDGHLNIANTGVLRAMVAAFNAMLARRRAPGAKVFADADNNGRDARVLMPPENGDC
jgi:hypothetical protein